MDMCSLPYAKCAKGHKCIFQLRKTLKTYSNSTHFALACNTSSKITELIQSKCALVRFPKVVVDAKKVPYVPNGLEMIKCTWSC
ncbi:putative P-loop containing nucleoside triphosphate hydrolase [Helianthus annuus]|nr:putative P-loop containing nucleoside triphosphate hydrolase [Helianthus annuus]KAJ0597237.1 putative P-loop containing nucleoside triphosphate hydrolase [Helianthus annuus]KAJ0757917.1 putative P-loop containing nucleoside triphosphate hydrolase [Helianthus annuus]